jgi:hypothetical protein
MTWTAADSGTADQLESVVFGKDRFVAVGYLSAVVGSADGSTWTNSVLAGDLWLHGVTYGHDRFVAVGEAGAVLASTDGVHWTIQDSGTDRSLQAVTCGANGFVAVGEPGLLLRSKTGADWQVDGLETNRWLFDVVEAEGLYVAVGAGGAVVRWDAQGPGGPLRLMNSRVLPDGRFEMTISGALREQPLTVLTSVNLGNWTPAATLTGDGGPVRFTNGHVSALAARYYRVTSP